MKKKVVLIIVAVVVIVVAVLGLGALKSRKNGVDQISHGSPDQG